MSCLLRCLLLCTLILAAMAEEDGYVRSVDAWHQKRIESLTRPDGWLALVGLLWLEPGANTFGTDPSNKLVFPSGAPFMGTYRVGKDGSVSLKTGPGVEPARDGPLDLKEPEGKTRFSLGTLSWYLIVRNGQPGLRLIDSASPVLTGFQGIERYPVDPSWRLTGRFEKAPRTISVPNVLGVDTRERSPGLLVFEHAGKRYQLEPVQEEGETRFFVIFSDQSNGHGSYAGGRFLYVDPPDEQGRVVLDFNRAYNPPCAFTHFATCPRPPAQNSLPFAVEAGEKAYQGH